MRNAFAPLIAAALFCAPAVALAQATPLMTPLPNIPYRGPGPDHHKMRHVLATLNLTPQQQSQIAQFHAEYVSSKSTTHPETGPQLRAKYESILTPEQRSEFDAQMGGHPRTL